ncbi:hypothetical protein E9993_03140 [Labilibacter sediminis]|nr:hypothetical protein E9993_03140 [Labilibacter sediminis]
MFIAAIARIINNLNYLLVKNKGIIYHIIFVVFLLVCSQGLKAQSDSVTIVSADTLDAKPVVIKPHSPHKATFYSAVLPGLGQAYNGKYWKIPILYAGFGGVIYAIHFNTKWYNTYRTAYRDFLIQDPGNKSYEDVLPVGLSLEDVENNGPYADWFGNALNNKKKYYKKYRDISYVGFALVYVLNLVDASVDAHFKTFDVSDDLSLHVEPIVNPGVGMNSVGLQLKLVF